jgi:cytochrome c biogenesis protein CcdA
VLAVFVLVGSIALADSLNPSTIAPALYLSTVRRWRAALISYTAGLLVVNLLGGALLLLGPGQILRNAIPHPGQHARHVLEVVSGVVVLCFAAAAWLGRSHVQGRLSKTPKADPRSAFLLGAGIALVELPTAFPYFAAIAAILGADLELVGRTLALLVFNVLFVAPILVVFVLRSLAAERAERWLQRAADSLQRRAAVVLAGLTGAAGLFLLVFGLTGMTGLR